MSTLLQEKYSRLNNILKNIATALDITPWQYDVAVKSYQAVGEHLSKPDSSLAPYQPEVLPQGSFLLGTTIKPINDDDELDLDLVCKLKGKKDVWTQYDLKQAVGNQLKDNDTYKKLLDK